MPWVYTLALYLLIAFGIASANDAAAGQQPMKFTLGQIFTFLFLMLVPFKIIAPFSQITKAADQAIVRRTAAQTAAFAGAALLIAAFLGHRMLRSFGIPFPILALAGGIIFFLVALQKVLHHLTLHGGDSANSVPGPSMQTAMMPLAFPTIVTPYGIAALLVFFSVSPDVRTTLCIGVIVLLIMLVNLIVMQIISISLQAMQEL